MPQQFIEGSVPALSPALSSEFCLNVFNAFHALRSGVTFTIDQAFLNNKITETNANNQNITKGLVVFAIQSRLNEIHVRSRGGLLMHANVDALVGDIESNGNSFYFVCWGLATMLMVTDKASVFAFNWEDTTVRVARFDKTKWNEDDGFRSYMKSAAKGRPMHIIPGGFVSLFDIQSTAPPPPPLPTTQNNPTRLTGKASPPTTLIEGVAQRSSICSVFCVNVFLELHGCPTGSMKEFNKRFLDDKIVESAKNLKYMYSLIGEKDYEQGLDRDQILNLLRLSTNQYENSIAWSTNDMFNENDASSSLGVANIVDKIKNENVNHFHFIVAAGMTLLIVTNPNKFFVFNSHGGAFLLNGEIIAGSHIIQFEKDDAGFQNFKSYIAPAYETYKDSTGSQMDVVSGVFVKPSNKSTPEKMTFVRGG